MNTLKRGFKAVMPHAVAIILAFSLWRMLVTSDVGLKMFDYPQIVSDTFVWAYIGALIATIFPYENASIPRKIHAVAAGFAVPVFLGRAWGFLELVQNNRPDLEGAVWERIAMLAIAIYYHHKQSVRAVLIEEIKREASNG